MLTVDRILEPTPDVWDIAIKGMRLPFKSTDKNDSNFCYGDTFEMVEDKTLCQKCPYYEIEWINPDDELDIEDNCSFYSEEGYPTYILGENDLKLFLGLCSAGDPSHRKVLRFLDCILFVNAPLYWWKQFDTYKVGTVANAESTMHTLVKRPFNASDFWIEDVDDNLLPDEDRIELIRKLNKWRDKYLETKDDKYWHRINQFLPHSFLQTRCVKINYETIITMFKQRINHKLPEWKDFLVEMYRKLPYIPQILEVTGLARTVGDRVEVYDEYKKEWIDFCTKPY